MNYKQIKLRLEALILKDEQMIRGYSLAMLNTYDDTKRSSYNSIISRLKTSIERKKEALEYIEMYPVGEFNWKDLCSKFRFRSYKL